MVAVSVTHGASGISVVYGGRVSSPTVGTRWQPRRLALWFGARTGASVDEHLVGRVTIIADALVEGDTVAWR